MAKKKKYLILALAAVCLAAVLFGLFWARYGHSVKMHLRYDPSPREPMPILMYHNLSEDGEDCNDMTVTVSKLRGDLQYILESGYTPVLPRELAGGTPLPEKPILISFDDGYRSNYHLLYPILKELDVKAVVNIIVLMSDLPASDFCYWYKLKEMSDSGLVEIGSHSYRLHNLGGSGGGYRENGVNGIERIPGESDEDFSLRVLDDIKLSYDRIYEELGVYPTCFAYPYGAVEPDAEALVDSLFPVTLITWPATADLHDGTRLMPRYTVTMDTDLSGILNGK